MKQSIHIIQQKVFVAIAIVAMAMLASCSAIQKMENETECPVGYYVRFKYDWNLKYADAFAHEVKTVTVYAFDPTGVFVAQKTENGERLSDDNYSMKLDVEPGEYHLIAWAGMDGESFTTPVLTPGQSTLADLTVKMHRLDDNTVYGNNAEHPRKLTPLWYGELENAYGNFEFYKSEQISLVKNTNTIRVILQEMSGNNINPEMFEFSIVEDNGWMNYNNALLADDVLTYLPYYTAGGSIINGEETKAEGDISVAIAELSTGRLIAEKNPRLRILNKETGKSVLNISLTEFLLMTKQSGHKMSDQEYLDRQDEASLTFILDKNLSWVSVNIQINEWIVRYENANFDNNY